MICVCAAFVKREGRGAFDEGGQGGAPAGPVEDDEGVRLLGRGRPAVPFGVGNAMSHHVAPHDSIAHGIASRDAAWHKSPWRVSARTQRRRVLSGLDVEPGEVGVLAEGR